MANDINRVTVEGMVLDAPRTQTFDDGGSRTSVRIITKRRWTDKATGEPKEVSNYLSVSGRGVTFAGVEQGDCIVVDGSLRSWAQTKDSGEKISGVEVDAQSVVRVKGSADAIAFPSAQEAASVRSTSGW